MWIADLVLALIAAAFCLPVREAKLPATLPTPQPA